MREHVVRFKTFNEFFYPKQSKLEIYYDTDNQFFAKMDIVIREIILKNESTCTRLWDVTIKIELDDNEKIYHRINCESKLELESVLKMFGHSSFKLNPFIKFNSFYLNAQECIQPFNSLHFIVRSGNDRESKLSKLLTAIKNNQIQIATQDETIPKLSRYTSERCITISKQVMNRTISLASLLQY